MIISLVLFLLALLGIPLGVGITLEFMGCDVAWDIAKIAQYFVIFYYYGFANAKRELRKGSSYLKLPFYIKVLLFLNLPNKFTRLSIFYQGILVTITIFAVFLTFIMKTNASLIVGWYIFFGFLEIVIFTLLRKRTF